MGRIIRLHDDPHRRTEMLLPWYGADQLDPDERAYVEAHLSDCADCREELHFEQRLRTELSALPVDPAGGWDRMRDRVTGASPPGAPVGQRHRGSTARTTRWPPRRHAAIMAQAACLALAVALASSLRPDAPYHALGAPGIGTRGNLIVMFRPDTSEQDMRRVLMASGAQLVDGPTAAGAYVLRVPAEGRGAALDRLRLQAAVVLAQPIDPDPRP